ncbi:hypothetical protein NNJEOMEG_01375 [Fundidesulfovibrio magnetotacticus]|uniref:Uncharacterized protein n=1 Tax=Fundidesulfovibrio magnetotacticus TaxID=2730080 RepID=A0A6V8LSJ3_9BACT|nr:hypothetical protein [Fundidesulfovibrio magnetotacticus]GFK93541.1 hypothetical protein NNJEOMEG_01375 [Fundidesulfovibrio magnetotacticus]
MSERLKPLIKEALREAQEEGLLRPGCCSSCDLAPGEHARHHMHLRDAFSLRSRVINTLATTLAGGGLAWLGLAVWEKLARQLPR